ncbi:hypothetical protein ACO0QE_003889 [Hanseniaspora vineae]
MQQSLNMMGSIEPSLNVPIQNQMNLGEYTPLNDDKNESNRRTHVKKACDACRAKKIKCDGLQPCGSCKKKAESAAMPNEIQCTFSFECKKKEPSKPRTSNKQILGMLTDKLASLEKMLNVIQENTIKRIKTSSPTSLSSAASSSSSATLIGQPTTTRTTTAKISYHYKTRRVCKYANSTHDQQNSNCPNYFKVQKKTNIKHLFSKASNHKQLSVATTNKVKPPFGAEKISGFLHDNEDARKYHIRTKCCFLILTQEGFNWVKKKIRLPDCDALLTKIAKLNELLRKDNELYIQKVFQRVESPTLVKPPEAILDVLCKHLPKTVSYAYSMLAVKSTQALIETYKTDLNTMEEEKLFLVNAVLLLTCSVAKCNKDLVSLSSKKELEFWEKVFLLNTVSFYQKFTLSTYNPETLKSGLLCLQSLWYLCIYLQNSPSPKVAVMIASAAITMAQELNIMAPSVVNSLENLEERNECRMLWFHWFAVDTNFSIWYGKPNYISIEQLTVCDRDCHTDFLAAFNMTMDPALFATDKCQQRYDFLSQSALGHYFIMFDLKFRLMGITSLAYKDILSVQNERRPLNDLKKDVDATNAKLLEFIASLKRAFKLSEDCSVEDVFERLIAIQAHNNTDFISLQFFGLNILLDSYTLLLIVNSKLLSDLTILDQQETSDITKSTILNLFKLCDLALNKCWSPASGCQVLFSLACAFCMGTMIAISDKKFLKEHVKTFVQSLKTITEANEKKGFIDPLIWSVITIYNIHLLRLLFLHGRDILDKSMVLQWEKVFAEDTKKLYNKVITISKSMVEIVEESNVVRRQAGRPIFKNHFSPTSLDTLLKPSPLDWMSQMSPLTLNALNNLDSNALQNGMLTNSPGLLGAGLQGLTPFTNNGLNNINMSREPSIMGFSKSNNWGDSMKSPNQISMMNSRSSALDMPPLIPQSPIKRPSVTSQMSDNLLRKHTLNNNALFFEQANMQKPGLLKADNKSSSQMPSNLLNTSAPSKTIEIPEALRDLYFDDIFGLNSFNALEFLDDEMFTHANSQGKE